MKRGFVIYSEEAGVYLGEIWGFGFWSKWDCVGQNAAVSFPSAESAMEFRSANNPNGWPECRAVEVDVDVADDYVSIASCVRSGMPSWDSGSSKSQQSYKERLQEFREEVKQEDQ